MFIVNTDLSTDDQPWSTTALKCLSRFDEWMKDSRSGLNCKHNQSVHLFELLAQGRVKTLAIAYVSHQSTQKETKMREQTNVTKMRECIDSTNEAARNGLYAPAIVARHDFITARMERATEYLKDLENQGKYEEVEALLRCDDLWVHMQRLQEVGSPET